jgi:predicted DNA-binding ribbon-helix-helix protein
MAIATDQTQTQIQPKIQPELAHHDLYEQDFCLWIEKALVLLHEENLRDLDLANLLEEIADMGNSQKQALESNLKIILMHLLKYKYQADKRTNSWRYTIVEHRQRIRKAFKNSPSLRRHFLQEFADVYLDARQLAVIETELPPNTFPVESPFTTDQALDEEYFPAP